MNFDTFLEKTKKFEIEAYKKTRNLPLTHVPFSGAPQKHPRDVDKILLVSDPMSTNTLYYEFDLSDVDSVEELPSLGTLEGKTITMVRIWVRKGSIGVRSTPFVVEDTTGRGGS